MSTTHPKETYAEQFFGQEEEWQFLEKEILKKTCSACVCMTCQYLIIPPTDISEQLLRVMIIVVLFLMEFI